MINCTQSPVCRFLCFVSCHDESPHAVKSSDSVDQEFPRVPSLFSTEFARTHVPFFGPTFRFASSGLIFFDFSDFFVNGKELRTVQGRRSVKGDFGKGTLVSLFFFRLLLLPKARRDCWTALDPLDTCTNFLPHGEPTLGAHLSGTRHTHFGIYSRTLHGVLR